MRRSHLNNSLANAMADFEREFNFLWSSLNAGMTTYNLISSGTSTNRLAFLRVKLRSAPSLFLPKLLQPPNFLPCIFAVSVHHLPRCQRNYKQCPVFPIINSMRNTSHWLQADVQISQNHFQDPSWSVFHIQIKTSLVLSDTVGHTSCGLFSASVPSIMSLVSFDASVHWSVNP